MHGVDRVAHSVKVDPEHESGRRSSPLALYAHRKEGGVKSSAPWKYNGGEYLIQLHLVRLPIHPHGYLKAQYDILYLPLQQSGSLNSQKEVLPSRRGAVLDGGECELIPKAGQSFIGV